MCVTLGMGHSTMVNCADINSKVGLNALQMAGHFELGY